MPEEIPIEPIGIDIRTKRPIKQKKVEPIKESGDALERQRQSHMFKEFVSLPAYEEFRKTAYALCKPGVNISGLDTVIVWGFRAAMRSGMDYLFNYVEELAKSKPAEEQPVVNKYRPSFFADNTSLPPGEL